MFRVSTGSGSTVGVSSELVSPMSGRCLDANGRSTTPGAKVEIWNCNGGAGQQWFRRQGPYPAVTTLGEPPSGEARTGRPPSRGECN